MIYYLQSLRLSCLYFTIFYIIQSPFITYSIIDEYKAVDNGKLHKPNQQVMKPFVEDYRRVSQG